MSQITHDSMYIANQHDVLTISNAVKNLLVDYPTMIQVLTSGRARSATKIWLTVVTGAINLTLDGTNPATDGSKGHPIIQYGEIEVRGWTNITNLKMIRSGSSDATVALTVFFTDIGLM